jgi:hypothetical protein
MRDRVVETFRTVLTITGLVLLIVFGSRAAGQAQNRQLAGATHRNTFGLPSLHFASPAYAYYGGQTISAVSKAVAARTTQTPAPARHVSSSSTAPQTYTSNTSVQTTESTAVSADPVQVQGKSDESMADTTVSANNTTATEKQNADSRSAASDGTKSDVSNSRVSGDRAGSDNVSNSSNSGKNSTNQGNGKKSVDQ